MNSNYEYVQKGFDILHPLMAGYIGQAMNKYYKSGWWQEVLDKLNDQYMNLPKFGEYADLIDSLDIANCLRLIDREWNDLFRRTLELNIRTWCKELMGIRNMVAHKGAQDMSQADAERALDTMARVCDAFDPDGAEEIRELYKQLRFGGEQEEKSPAGPSVPAGPAPIDIPGQTGGAVVPGENGTINLLALIGTEFVQKTTLTRKVTYAGKTAAYPVYKVRLDILYYNDQNDRIATWITRYRGEHGEDSLGRLTGEEYNGVIENFIFESNPASIQKTQNNIDLVGQRVPGVALADGRIVDGNRSYTCLRRLQREKPEPLYFETVIMDVDIQRDRKQIKILELAIQHGEEEKVDYDLIDYAIGTYRDVVQTKLLTVQEYAESTNETVSEVQKRINIATIICEFLEYLKVPEQYHIARMYSVHELFKEMLPALNSLSKEEQTEFKRIIFNNVLMKAVADQRKFVRDVRGLIKNDAYQGYFAEQMKLSDQLHKTFDTLTVRSKEDLDRFAMDNEALAEELQISLQRALLRSRKSQVLGKPIENVNKCINLMTEVDSRLFGKLSDAEKRNLAKNLTELCGMVNSFTGLLTEEEPQPAVPEVPASNGGSDPAERRGQFRLAPTDPTRPYVLCTTAGIPITRFFVTMNFAALALGETVIAPAECRACFVDDNGNIISDVRTFTLEAGDVTSANFFMLPDSLNLNRCRLVIQDKNSAPDEALQMIPFELNITSDFRK